MRLSTKNISILPCGHAMHFECLVQVETHGDEKGNVTCPTCRMSIHRNLEHEEFMASMIRSTPMPEELRHVRVEIVCNDCLKHSVEPFHFYGAICSNEECRSLNTSSVRTITDPNEVVQLPPWNVANRARLSRAPALRPSGGGGDAGSGAADAAGGADAPSAAVGAGAATADRMEVDRGAAGRQQQPQQEQRAS